MSHYCVAVIHKQHQDINWLLSRYDEGLSVIQDPEDGYWYNPDAKWDWYEEGGRWDGYIKLKDGESVNEALIKDISFGINQQTYKECVRWWEVVVDGKPLEDGESKSDFFNWYKREYLIERYGNADTYAKESSSFRTYAVVTPDGEWHEPGTMGWFGMSSATAEDEKRWVREFDEIINASDPNDILTIVDCHI